MAKKPYLALLRGINVGGHNLIPMAALRERLEEWGFTRVETYIQSGNVLLDSARAAASTARQLEQALPRAFTITRAPVRVLVLTPERLAAIVANAPKGFGSKPDTYKYDVAFLFDDLCARAVSGEFETHPEVDAVHPGEGVVYYRRLTARLTRSRLSKITAKPVYQQLTIRNWNTTTRLHALLQERG